MAPRFADLPPEHDKNAVADAVSKIVQEMHCQLSYETISSTISTNVGKTITAAAIRAFLRRNPEAVRLRGDNSTLAALYEFLFCGYEHGQKVRALIAKHTNVLLPQKSLGDALMGELELSLLSQFQDWLNLPPAKISEFAAKFAAGSSKYAVLRKSTRDPRTYIASRMIVKRVDSPRTMVRAIHIQKDPAGVDRVSRGGLVPVVRNIYGILKVENAEGLELFAFRNPLQQRFRMLHGLLVTIDIDGRLYATNALMEPLEKSPMWGEIDERFRPETLSPDKRTFVEERIELLKNTTPLRLPEFAQAEGT